MAFGSKNKKRESWSSRPLSMILSDNVWLFKNKSRNSIEKAMQPTNVPSSKQIESTRPTAEASAAPVSSSGTMPRKSTDGPLRTTAPARSQASTAKPERTIAPEPAEVTVDKEKKDAPPFLTLNLESSAQRLDVPEQYLDESVISDEFYNQTGSTSELEQTPEADLPDAVLGPLSGLEVRDTVPELKASPESGEIDHFEPKTANAPTTASNAMSVSPDRVLDDNLLDDNLRDATRTSATSAASATRESTIDSGHSGSSLVTVDGTARRDSYLLGSNRKVVVGRGVYIFDPTEPGEARELRLTAAESFNPFEFD